MSTRSQAWSLGLAIGALLASLGRPSYALPRRPHFEPTDLLFEEPGDVEVNMQFGPAFRAGAHRLYLPDFEIDLGLTDNVEIDVDGAFAEDGFDTANSAFAADPLWPSMKLGFLDVTRTDTQRFALGAQLGPRVPAGPGMAGVGYGALVLFGVTSDTLHVALNGGAIVDPGPARGAPRPAGFVGGIDLALGLGKRITVLGELGGSVYASRDPNELNGSLGLVWHETDRSDISLVGLVGFLAASRQGALLLGFTPRFSLF